MWSWSFILGKFLPTELRLQLRKWVCSAVYWSLLWSQASCNLKIEINLLQYMIQSLSFQQMKRWWGIRLFISDIKYNHDENRKRKETWGRRQQEEQALNCGVVIFSARRTQVCALKKISLFSLVFYRTLVFQDPFKTIVCLSVKTLVPWSPESPSVPTATHRSSFSCQSHTWPVVSSGPWSPPQGGILKKNFSYA